MPDATPQTNSDSLKKLPQVSETPKMTKDTSVLTNDRYNTPKTSLLIYHFDPYPFISPDVKLHNSIITHATIDEKDLYVFDTFFVENEARELREFSEKAPFTRTIFADHE